MPALIGSRRALFYNTPAVAAAASPTATHVGSHYIGGAGSDITVNGNIGTQASSRVVIAFVFDGNDAVSGVTCGGAAMSAVVSAPNAPNNCKMWALKGASGGSGAQDIVATLSGAYHQRAMQVWTIEGLASTTEVATDTVYGATSNLDFTAAAGDIIVAGGFTNSAGNWNSSTEAPDDTEASVLTGGYELYSALWNTVTTNGAFTANYSTGFFDGMAAQYR